MDRASQERRISQRKKQKPRRYGWQDEGTRTPVEHSSLNQELEQGGSQHLSEVTKYPTASSRKRTIRETPEELKLQISEIDQEMIEIGRAINEITQNCRSKAHEIESDNAALQATNIDEEKEEIKGRITVLKEALAELEKNFRQKQLIDRQLDKCRRKIGIKLYRLENFSSDDSDDDSSFKENDVEKTIVSNHRHRHQSVSEWAQEASKMIQTHSPPSSEVRYLTSKQAEAAADEQKEQEFEEAQLAEIDQIEKEAEAKKRKIATEIEARRQQRQNTLIQQPVKIPLPTASGTSEELMIQLLQTQLQLLQNQSPQATSNKFLARQSHAKDLPYFGGRPEEWPTFFTSFNETTTICGFSAAENMGRLRKCLKGDAAKLVECLMVSSGNLPAIMKLLENRYGQPDHIVKALISKAKAVPSVREEKLESIIEFGIAVHNMTSTMKALKCESHLLNPQLLDELEQKLSVRQRMDWLKWIKSTGGKTQGLVDFAEWLQQETEFASRLCPPKQATEWKDSRKPDRRDKVFTTSKVNFQKKREGKCNHCDNEGHWMYECRKFAQLSEEERWKQVTAKRLCFLCLRPGHRTDACKSKRMCGHEGCSGRHHQLLHKVQSLTSKPGIGTNTTNNPTSTTEAHTVGHTTKNRDSKSKILLKIVPVILSGPAGDIRTYAFFDEGSTLSMMDASTAEKLGLNGEIEPLCIQWTNGVTRTEQKSQRVSVKISGDYHGAKQYSMYGVRTVRNISLPSQTVDKDELAKQWPHLTDAEVQTMFEAKPTLLIGEDYLPLIVSRKVIHGPWNAPYLSHTWLGWVIHGQESKAKWNENSNYSFTICHKDDPDDLLHQLVKDSFRTENFGVRVIEEKPRSREDKRAIGVMEATTNRIGNRFETGLLWKDPDCKLPDSKFNAVHRLTCLEKKIDKDGQLLKWYVDKIKDYELKGFVKKLTKAEAAQEGPRTWYLPHFFAFHPNKPGKPRLVFDAAAKSKGVSLNDHIMKGPDLVNPLPSVLFKFRQRRYGITADIQEMFHQVLMRQEDRSSQRFLWRGEDRQQDPDVYEIQVMFFGSSSSPSSAQFVKNLNAAEFKEDHPLAYEAIVKKHYVDDYIDSVDSIDEGSKLAKEVTEIHKRGGFHIRGWISNERKILHGIPADLRADGLKFMDQISELPTGRVLGLVWDPEEDAFVWNLNFSKVPEVIVNGTKIPTKREVLKLVMSIFDPLGFLAHFVIKAKILLQAIWRSEIGWDDQIPVELNEQWQVWILELSKLTRMKIPRCYHFMFSSPDSNRQLHIFCDASKDAFSAVAFLRLEYGDQVETSFVAAKSKVAPLKPLSIPRMELQAAVLGSRLAHTINEEHDIKFDKTVFWSDSITVLSWIRADAKTFKTFVAHRIGEIEELTDAASWRWVPTKENVADDATRPNYPCDLSSGSRWLWGPPFLKLEENQWPTEDHRKPSDADEINEELISIAKVNTTTTISVKSNPIFEFPELDRFSSYWKLIRCTAWVSRFAYNIMDSDRRKFCGIELLPSDLLNAERAWWKRVQRESFGTEIKNITKGEPVDRKSILGRLSPFLDEFGTLRVHSRIINATAIDESTKYPVILHPNHPFTILLIRYYHEAANHHGYERVLNNIRTRFWIPTIRAAVKKSWSKCQLCKNTRSEPAVPEMGQLPLARVTAYNPPFTCTGMDYFGPMEVTIGRRREKRYGVLFTCMATRAVHLEIAASLTTDSTIMAIRRMAARRGHPKEIFSDNGTNLRGADTELRKSLQDLAQNELQQQLMTMGEGIVWHFNPPAAPHMGGTWERCVRSVKIALHAILKERAPKEETLQTLFAEAEVTVNSQPLTHVSVDPDDPVALTPNNFLIARGVIPTAPGVFVKEDLILRKQWRTAQMLADMFWKRWISEYLPTLTRRTKWNQQVKPIAVDDVVIIVDNSGPRATWPLGIITAVYPGKDSRIRVVDVRTNSGTYRRPVSKICVLDVYHTEKNVEIIKSDIIPLIKGRDEDSSREGALQPSSWNSNSSLNQVYQSIYNQGSFQKKIRQMKKSGEYQRIMKDYLEWRKQKKAIKNSKKPYT